MSRVVLLLCLVAMGGVAPSLARAQQVGGESASEPTTGTAPPSWEEPVPEEDIEPDDTAGLMPGVADGRLAQSDDGIDDVFSAWVSERIFSGPSGAANADTSPVVTPSNDGASSFLLHTELGVRFGITRDARARVDWGFAYSTSHVRGDYADSTTTTVSYDARVERVEAQNPSMTFEWAPIIGNTRFSFGLGVAAPTAAGENIPTDASHAAVSNATNVTHQLMLAAAGGLTPWRYRRERMAVFLPLTLLLPIDRITIALEGAAAISAPVTGAGAVPVTGDLLADIQICGDLIPELRLGARLGLAVLSIGASTGTIVQPSATGYLRVRLDPGFLIASVLVDLGGPYGLNSSGGVWSATLGGGVAIP